MSDWQEMATQGRFIEAEPLMLAETEGEAGAWPKDPESQGWFYESWGDALGDSPDAEAKYREAYNNFSIFASWSTSGGEGTARMMDVNRVLQKLEEIRLKSL